MDKERYNRVKQIVTLAIGVAIAFGIIRQSWTIPLATITLGFLALYIVRKQVKDVLHDERNIAIQQKAASRTLGYATAFTGFLGIGLVELSFHGFSEFRSIGYAFAYQANMVLALYAFFTWYYQRQMGG
jgi:uncharacterized membrane protein